jgi:hypothetical protein
MRNLLGLALVLALPACGDDGPPPVCSEDGGAACFQLPTEVLVAHAGTDTDSALLGCGALAPTDSTIAVTLSGTITKYGADPIDGAALEVFDDAALAGTPIATATTASDGSFTFSLPAGTPDLLYGTIVADGYFDAELHNARPDLTADVTGFDLVTLDADLLGTLAALVNDEVEPATVAMAVVVSDCARYNLEHAVVTLSTAAGTRAFVPGASVYYGTAGAIPLPVIPEDGPDTADNGAVAVVNAPEGDDFFLQAWGFPDADALAQGAAGLVLIAEYPVHTTPGSIQEFVLFANQD